MIAWKKIYIEITNRCNLSCPFCARTRRPPGTMAPADFGRILARIRGCTRHLALHVLGEPLLHPELAVLLDLCREQGMRVNLATNGTLLDRHRPLLLQAPALRQVSISLQALTHLEAAPAARHLEQIIDFAREASRDSGLFLSLRWWTLGGAVDPAQAERQDRLLARLRAAFPEAGLEPGRLLPGRGIPLAPRVFLNPEQSFHWPDPSDPDLGRLGFCRGLRDHLAVLVDGTVVPCCLDSEGHLALGNLRRQTLAAILDDTRARRLREGFAHQWLVESLCRRCTYRLRFAVDRPERPRPHLSP